jgi:RNA-directed DNA polymerase
MYRFSNIKTDLNTEQITALSRRFELLETAQDLASLLKCNVETLRKLAAAPTYQQFHIPKPGGEKRFIQAPQSTLKTIQSEINRYMQAAYHLVKPPCSHGFIMSANDDTQPRNIYSNALTHVRGQWFVNVDLKDFFHTVTKTHIYELFRLTFSFKEDLAKLLTGLCTFQGRLPMGAPTSPVLSNFVFYFMDYQLMELAQLHEGKFSRYADDLTFSFQHAPAEDFMDYLRHIVVSNGFVVNEKKVRLQSRLENPEITGLHVTKNNKPTPTKMYLKTLKKEVAIYRWLMTEAVQERGLFPNWLFDQFRKSVAGQLEFVGFILGKNDVVFKKLDAKLRWG